MKNDSTITPRIKTIISLIAILIVLAIGVCMVAFAAEKPTEAVKAATVDEVSEVIARSVNDTDFAKETPEELYENEAIKVSSTSPASVNFTLTDESLNPSSDIICWYAYSMDEIAFAAAYNPTNSYVVKEANGKVTELYDGGSTVEIGDAYFGMESMPGLTLGDEVTVYFLIEY